jgi:Ca-activated chloride channel family protein
VAEEGAVTSALATALSFGGLDARVHLVWAVLLVVLLAFRAERRRRAALRLFVTTAGALGGLAATARRRRWRTGLLSLGLVTLLFAALQPRSNPVPVRAPARVRDLAILIDVSRSMLAEDRKPNRLESVKLEVARLLDHLQGDRVGLIAFAGEARVVTPLTSAYSSVKRSLRTVGPQTVDVGGTKIGDAIRKAVRDLLGFEPSAGPGDDAAPKAGETVLDPLSAKREGRDADILLLTDGEDHDSYPEHAARELRRLGIGLTIVGVGSPEGREIPTGDGVLRYHGEVVRSALQDKQLRELVVEAGRGRYLPASVHHFDLVDLYDQVIRRDTGREVTEEKLRWQEVYQPFALAGLALVLLAFAVPVRPPAPRRGREETP